MHTRLFLLMATCFFQLQIFAQTNPNIEYAPPFFADTMRAKKIKILAPIIDKMYADYALANHLPGYAYGVMIDGELLVSGAGGFTDIGKKINANTRSMFRIASMSKSFTAMAIIKLRDDGKLKLDDPISMYIPALKAQKLTNDAAEITIRELMTHAAGFPEDNPWGDRQLADTEEELIALFKKGISFSNVNGTAYEYSNVGFATLGLLIKKVTGISYNEYIEQNIWKRLGMQASWEYSKVPETQLAKGYRWINQNWKEEALLHDGIYGAMGGMISSIESFSKYLALHQQAWPARNEEENIIIKRSSLREMHQAWRFNTLNPLYKYSDGRNCAVVNGYGYGLAVLRDCDNKVIVGHSGGLPGFGSNWRFMPDYGLGLMFFANLTYAPTAAFNSRVIDTLVKLAALKPRTLIASPILRQRKNELVKLLPAFNGAIQSGIFAENFFMDYYSDSLKQEAMGIYKTIGKTISIGEIIPENQLRGSFTIHGEKGKAMIFFTLTPENPALIQEYNIRLLK